MTRRRNLLTVPAALLAMMAATAPAGAYDPLTWHSIAGGGVARATAGGYTLGGTIGQPDAGTLAAGTFLLRGGLWFGGQPHGVGVADGSEPALSFRLYPMAPNPVRSRSRVAFDLPRAARVALSVFDVSGRAVHRWELGLQPAGHQELVWSAADGGGRSLSSGVYFLRLEAGRDQGVRRFVVVH